MLAGTIGSRPVGTPANARAREYIVDQLKLFGFEVRVQETDARRPELGSTARVANIIGVLPGRAAEAIGLRLALRLVARRAGSDRRCAGRGGVARGGAGLRRAGRRQWSLLVLVTDGEESRTDGRGRARHRSRSHGPAARLPQPRVDRIGRHGDAVRDRDRETPGSCRRGRGARRTRAADRTRSRSTSGCRTTPTSRSSRPGTFPA